MFGLSDFAEKFILALLGPGLTLMFAAVVGPRIAAWWNDKQKRRELELALANSFYSSYGEFCAIWKQWNWCFHNSPKNSRSLREKQLSLHERSCMAEGTLEAVLLKIAAERRLSATEAVELGNLRQAFQILRESIEDSQPISYGVSDDPAYLEFKRLATATGNMLVTKWGAPPTPTEASESFKEITDNRHEPRWLRVRFGDFSG